MAITNAYISLPPFFHTYDPEAAGSAVDLQVRITEYPPISYFLAPFNAVITGVATKRGQVTSRLRHHLLHRSFITCKHTLYLNLLNVNIVYNVSSSLCD